MKTILSIFLTIYLAACPNSAPPTAQSEDDDWIYELRQMRKKLSRCEQVCLMDVGRKSYEYRETFYCIKILCHRGRFATQCSYSNSQSSSSKPCRK